MVIRLWNLTTASCKFFLVTPKHDIETMDISGGGEMSPESLEQHKNSLQLTSAFQMLGVCM